MNNTSLRPIFQRSSAGVGPHRKPWGYVLLMTLGALAFISTALFSIIPVALQSKRQTRNETLRLQAEYLLRAVLQNSLDRLQSDTTYLGETFSLTLPTPTFPTTQQPSAQQGVEGLSPSAMPVKAVAVNYRADGEVKVHDKSISIRFTLMPAPPTSNQPRASDVEGDTPSEFETTPTSAQPHVTINRSWKLPDALTTEDPSEDATTSNP